MPPPGRSLFRLLPPTARWAKRYWGFFPQHVILNKKLPKVQENLGMDLGAMLGEDEEELRAGVKNVYRVCITYMKTHSCAYAHT
jgi:hypothetical protein